MPLTSQGKMESQVFSRSHPVADIGQLFSFILGISKVWKEYLRFLFSDYVSARRLERPEETSVDREQCDIANAFLTHPSVSFCS